MCDREEGYPPAGRNGECREGLLRLASASLGPGKSFIQHLRSPARVVLALTWPEWDGRPHTGEESAPRYLCTPSLP